jgi:hypothetical protein
MLAHSLDLENPKCITASQVNVGQSKSATYVLNVMDLANFLTPLVHPLKEFNMMTKGTNYPHTNIMFATLI